MSFIVESDITIVDTFLQNGIKALPAAGRALRPALQGGQSKRRNVSWRLAAGRGVGAKWQELPAGSQKIEQTNWGLARRHANGGC